MCCSCWDSSKFEKCYLVFDKSQQKQHAVYKQRHLGLWIEMGLQTSKRFRTHCAMLVLPLFIMLLQCHGFKSPENSLFFSNTLLQLHEQPKNVICNLFVTSKKQNHKFSNSPIQSAAKCLVKPLKWKNKT